MCTDFFCALVPGWLSGRLDTNAHKHFVRFCTDLSVQASDFACFSPCFVSDGDTDCFVFVLKGFWLVFASTLVVVGVGRKKVP